MPEDEKLLANSEKEKDVEETINADGYSWHNESVGQQRKNTSSTMNLITFFKAIPESNKARIAIKEEAKRIRKEKEKEKEWKDEDQNEVLSNIFQYLPFRTRINLTETNTDLYKFFNDCQKTRLVGVDNINPSIRFDPYTLH